MQFGYIIALISVTEMLKIYWLSEAFSSVMSRFVCGVINLDLNMPDD